MRLAKAQIQNFRSIVDSGVIEFDDRLTVLIGKNEQGKTTVLKALASVERTYIYGPHDLPQHLSARLLDQPKEEIPIVTLWFLPENSDRQNLSAILPEIDKIDRIKLVRYYDGHYEFRQQRGKQVDEPLQFPPPDINLEKENVTKVSTGLRLKFSAHASRLSTFSPHVQQANDHLETFLKSNFSDVAQIDNLIQTLTAALTAIPGQDPAIQEDIASATKQIAEYTNAIKQKITKDPLETFLNTIPRFVFHSTVLDRIPNEVNLAEFIKDPEGTPNGRGMANLCLAAGLSFQRIQQLAGTQDTQQRHAYEDHYRYQISGGINEYWTQEKYQVHFQFEKDKLTVAITDSTYDRRIPPSDRSEGFQWYLSFYSMLISAVSTPKPTVLLLDNPGLELHADGQKDIKRFLEAKLPAVTQIVYVTHSPAMIDPFHLGQVRQVELQTKDRGTKVDRLRIKSGTEFDLLEPVRSAIGSSLVNSLMFNEFNVLVEGAADAPILEGALDLRKDVINEKITVNGSIAESQELVFFLERARLPYAVYVDADSSGREISSELQRGGIDSAKIVALNNAVQRQGDYELEDILSAEFYQLAVKETYPDSTVEVPSSDEGKRTKRFATAFREKLNIGFNKRRVAENIKKLLLEGRGDTISLESLNRVTDAVLAALRAQSTSVPVKRPVDAQVDSTIQKNE